MIRVEVSCYDYMVVTLFSDKVSKGFDSFFLNRRSWGRYMEIKIISTLSLNFKWMAHQNSLGAKVLKI